jgi:sortase A
VLPHELDDIEIVPGKDYMTLVTCTPYGVNTHRLLVRAHRIANAREHIRVTADAVQIDPRLVALGLGVIMVLMFVLYLIIKGFIRN